MCPGPSPRDGVGERVGTMAQNRKVNKKTVLLRHIIFTTHTNTRGSTQTSMNYKEAVSGTYRVIV